MTMTIQEQAVAVRLADNPVTVAEYAVFVAATGHRPLPDWVDASDPAAPVVGIDYSDAAGYCAWAGGRLPTDEEWQAWVEGLPADDPRRRVTNNDVWEWTSTPYGEDTPTDPACRRVVRGGSWSLIRGYSRAAYRDHSIPGNESSGLGVRLAAFSAPIETLTTDSRVAADLHRDPRSAVDTTAARGLAAVWDNRAAYGQSRTNAAACTEAADTIRALAADLDAARAELVRVRAALPPPGLLEQSAWSLDGNDDPADVARLRGCAARIRALDAATESTEAAAQS